MPLCIKALPNCIIVLQYYTFYILSSCQMFYPLKLRKKYTFWCRGRQYFTRFKFIDGFYTELKSWGIFSGCLTFLLYLIHFRRLTWMGLCIKCLNPFLVGLLKVKGTIYVIMSVPALQNICSSTQRWSHTFIRIPPSEITWRLDISLFSINCIHTIIMYIILNNIPI